MYLVKTVIEISNIAQESTYILKIFFSRDLSFRIVKWEVQSVAENCLEVIPDIFF